MHNLPWRWLGPCGLIGLLALLVAQLVPAVGAQGVEQRLLYQATDGAVIVYNIDNGHRRERSITLAGYARARGIQANIGNGLLYISYLDTPRGRAELVAIDLRTDGVIWSKPYPGADAIALTPDGTKLFMSSGEGATADYFYVIDGRTGDETGRITVASQTHNGLVNRAGTRAYLASVKYKYLVEADTATNEVLRRIGPFGGEIRPLAVNGSGTVAYVNVNGLLGFEVADLVTGRVTHRVAVAGFPVGDEIDPSHGIGLTPDERELWVAGARKPGTTKSWVHIFDATVMPPKYKTSVQTRYSTKWINFSIDGRYAYTGSSDVFEVATHRSVAEILWSKRQIEIDFAGTTPLRAADMYGNGQVGANPLPTPTGTLQTATATAPASYTALPGTTATATATSSATATATATSTSTPTSTASRAGASTMFALLLGQ